MEKISPAMIGNNRELQRHLRVVESTLLLPEQKEAPLSSGVSDTPQMRRPLPDRSSLPPLSFERFRKRKIPETTDASALPAPFQQQKEVCSTCKGRGFLREEVPYGHPLFGKPKACQCTIMHRPNKLFGGAHIPEDFRDFSFESYLQQPLANEQAQVAMRVQGFMLPRLEGYEGRKRGLYLYGICGMGKTGLAASALRLAIAAGKSGLYLSTTELFKMLYEAIAASQRLSRGYGNQEDKEEESAGAKLLRLVESVEWLVLDDLGVECASPFVINHLYQLLEGRRSERNLYTIFTSNKDARGLEQHWRPNPGAAAFDDCERIIQRLGEYCVVVPLAGRSLRER